ncbi:MAG: phosphatase PAP2 family protein [Ignavibacteria bacterium]|nr:phosphatase PAP2 family protein [Ignavibacteria bacterium]
MASAVILLALVYGAQECAVAQLQHPGEASTLHNVSAGFAHSFAWYDIPVGVAWLSHRNFPIAPGTKFSIPVPGFDYEIQRRLAGNGKPSPGSVDPHLFPRLAFASRMLYTLAADEWSDQDIDERDYQHAFVFYKAVLYTHTLTDFVKNVTARERPDNEDDRSFFSGHTSVTFVTSAFLFREIDDYLDSESWAQRSPALKMGLKMTAAALLYGWAAYVGYSRIYDNKHFLSDVLIGAAVGTLMGNIVYNSYFSEESSIPAHISLGYIQSSPALSIIVPLN